LENRWPSPAVKSVRTVIVGPTANDSPFSTGTQRFGITRYKKVIAGRSQLRLTTFRYLRTVR
jgi:hypothetical protein